MGASNRLRARVLLKRKPLVTSGKYIERLVEIRKKIILDIKKHRGSKGFISLAKQNRAYVTGLIEREKEFLRWDEVWERDEVWIPAQKGFDPSSIP